MQPGDLLLVRTHHFASRLIRFGQRSYAPEFAQWNHVAVVVAPEDSEGNGRIVEALTKGVVLSPADKYPGIDTRIIHGLLFGTEVGEVPPAMRRNAVAFALSCVGESYGWLTILAIAVKALTKGRLDFGISGTSICSGLAARALERLGHIWTPYDPAELTPAYLAKALA